MKKRYCSACGEQLWQCEACGEMICTDCDLDHECTDLLEEIPDYEADLPESEV